MITIDKTAWERGVRDGFATGIRGLCPDALDPYSYWRGWIEGDAARHGEEVTEEAAKICGWSLPRENKGYDDRRNTKQP